MRLAKWPISYTIPQPKKKFFLPHTAIFHLPTLPYLGIHDLARNMAEYEGIDRI